MVSCAILCGFGKIEFLRIFLEVVFGRVIIGRIVLRSIGRIVYQSYRRSVVSSVGRSVGRSVGVSFISSIGRIVYWSCLCNRLTSYIFYFYILIHFLLLRLLLLKFRICRAPHHSNLECPVPLSGNNIPRGMVSCHGLVPSKNICHRRLGCLVLVHSSISSTLSTSNSVCE